MHRSIRAASWLFFTVLMYLILTEALNPWFRLPGLGNIGFTLVFVLFALLHCTALEGARRTAIFFLISAIVSWLMEEIGVRTGLIYGAYHYSNALGAKLGHVPVLIPLAWFMMIYPSWMVARALVRGIAFDSLPGRTATAAIAAIVMTAWDVVMDPGMSSGAGNWIWEHGGSYFGVPLHNYFGWLLTTFVVYSLAAPLWKSNRPRTAATKIYTALPVIVYAFFALRYVAANHFPELRLVAFFVMGMPGLLALSQLFLKQSEPTAA